MPESDRDVELARLPEQGKTTRTLIICATIVITFIAACVTYVQVNQNQWIAFVIALFGPSGIAALIIRLLYSHFRASKKRERALESAIESLQRENRELQQRLLTLPVQATGAEEVELPNQHLD